MDALTILRREHTRIAQLFVEFDALPARACVGRRALVREIDELTRRHLKMEEALAGSAYDAAHRERVLELLDRAAGLDCRDAAYIAHVHELRDELMRHVREALTPAVYPEVA